MARSRFSPVRSAGHLMKTGLLAGTLALVVTPAVVLAQGAQVVASGLNNPRGIAFAPNGDLYVAEAGIGGSGPCVASPSQPVQRCYGTTGAITRIRPEGGFERILSGLPSLALPGGFAEGGVADISFLGTSLYATFGWGGDPANRAALGDLGKVFGTTWHVTPSGRYQVIADVAAHERVNNPAGGPVDSNTYGILALPGRRIVADAGANALIELAANGRTRTLAVVPPITVPAPRESVPTSVALGPDGALYVGQLTGFPFFTGAASVLRVASDGSSVATFASGFTAIVDVAFDNGGALYVLEIASGQSTPFPPPNPGLGAGRLKRQCPGEPATVVLDGLLFPAGVAIGPDDAAYVTNRSTLGSSGQVLRLPLTPCP